MVGMRFDALSASRTTGVLMSQLLRRRPSPALVIASLALVFALTGTGIAAVTALPRNSVGTRQLRNNAVVSSKVRNHSLLARDFRAGQLPRGPIGPAGPAGPAGPPGPARARSRSRPAPAVSAPSAAAPTWATRRPTTRTRSSAARPSTRPAAP